MRIEYLYTEGKIGDRNTPVKVGINLGDNSKIVGTMKPVEGGWAYFPLHCKKGGDVYPTLDLCQKSLEFTEEE